MWRARQRQRQRRPTHPKGCAHQAAHAVQAARAQPRGPHTAPAAGHAPAALAGGVPAGERRARGGAPPCIEMGRLLAWPSPVASPRLLALGERTMPWEVALANGETAGPSWPPPAATEASAAPGGGVTRPVPLTAAGPAGAWPSARALARCDLMACSASASTFLRHQWGRGGEGRGQGRRGGSVCGLPAAGTGRGREAAFGSRRAPRRRP